MRRAAKQRVSAAAISVASKGRLTISEMPAAIKILASISSIDAVATRMGRSEAALQSEAAQASADFSGGRPGDHNRVNRLDAIKRDAIASSGRANPTGS